MEESYANLPTSHLIGSVPAVVSQEEKTTSQEAPVANLQIFAPNKGVGGGQQYQTLENPSGVVEQPANSWKGLFTISSYMQYFDVDTDVVLNRLMSSLYPTNGDFFSKIDANPDLFGLVWISTTLVFVVASFGNCATYLMDRRSDSSTSWNFDVSYVNVAACSIYGYAVVVPLAFYFLLHYLGTKASLVPFWCMWGYSLSIFILSSFLLVIPVEFLRWSIITITGIASAAFVASNLSSYIEENDVTVVIFAAFILQMGLALFIKMWFFA